MQNFKILVLLVQILIWSGKKKWLLKTKNPQFLSNAPNTNVFIGLSLHYRQDQ